MKEFKITGIPEGYEPIDKDINKSIREVKYLEYYFLDGSVFQWDLKHESKSRYLVLKKVEKQKEYRPFENAAEAELFFDRRLKQKNPLKGENDSRYRIVYITNLRVSIGLGQFDYKEAFDIFVFDDGTPFGIEVTE